MYPEKLWTISGFPITVCLTIIYQLLKGLKEALGIDALKEEIAALDAETANEAFWNDVANSNKVLQKLAGLKNKVKKYEESYNLTAGTILNLGTLKYEREEPDHSGWSLPGDYNGWNTNATYLYEEGDFYVAKNVSGLDKGFKFNHAEFGWKGVSSSEAVAAGKWHKFGGEENIKLADNKAYDIYMTKDGKQFQAVFLQESCMKPCPQE